MSTVRTPHNTVNENEEVSIDKTVRATNFDPVPMASPQNEEPDKPLDGTIRAAMPMVDMSMNEKPSANKSLDGTIRVPQMPQMPIEEPVAPKHEAPKMSAPKPVIEIVGAGGGNPSGTVRAAGFNQPITPATSASSVAPPPQSEGGTKRAAQLQGQAKVRPNINISIISSASNTQRANKLKQQRNEVDENIFVLKGQNYKRVQILSENTGEAQVFLVEKD